MTSSGDPAGAGHATGSPRTRRWVGVLSSLLLLAPCLASGPAACERGPSQQELLADASSQVTFASVEGLGPHLFQVDLVRETERRGGGTVRVEEQVEIAWQSWDLFSVKRTSDGRTVVHNVVYGAVPWVQVGGRWEEREDAEPHRVQLRTTWDTWKAELAPFEGHMVLTYDGDDVVEGRKALRYTVGLPPETEGAAPRTRRTQLRSLDGTVWLDEATAVRLKADVTAVTERSGLARTTTLHLARSRFGQDQGIEAPSAAEPPPAPIAP